MCHTIKITIPIQSFSDVVTNSSSELFCLVYTENLDALEYILTNVFQEGHLEVWLRLDSDEKPCAEVWWSYRNPIQDPELAKAVIEHILNDKIGKDNYKIDYERF